MFKSKLKLSQGPSKSQALLICLFLVSVLALFFRLFDLPPNNLIGGRDETKYVLLAKQQIDAKSLSLPEQPQYPPGWPLIISICLRANGGLQVVHMVNFILLFACGGIVWYYCYLRTNSTIVSSSILLLFLSSKHSIVISDSLLSEPLFLFVFLIGVLFAATQKMNSNRNVFLLGIIAVICRSIRTVGISVWAATIVYLLFIKKEMCLKERLKKSLILTIPLLIFEPILFYSYQSASFVSGSGYLKELEENQPIPSNILRKGGVHVFKHIRAASLASIPIERKYWGKMYFIIVAGGMMISLLGIFSGIWGCVVERRLDASLFCAYLLLIFLWYYRDSRLFWPVVPFFYLYSYESTIKLIQFVRPYRCIGVKIATGVLVAIAFISITLSIYHLPLTRTSTQKREARFSEALAWIKTHHHSDNPVVASYHSYRIYWFRKNWTIVPLPLKSNEYSIPQYDYVLLENRKLKIKKHQATIQGLDKIFENKTVTVFSTNRLSPATNSSGSTR